MNAVNNANIETFNQNGAEFWDPNGPYKTLHQINPARLKFIEKFIDLKNSNILDIGCGGGALSEAMAKKGATVSGIDLSASMIQAAESHLASQSLSISYRQISSGDCVKNKERYQNITCMEMLEHVPNPAAILSDIYQLLVPGGYVFLSTLNRNIKSYMLGILVAERIAKLVPKGTHEHQAFIKPVELANMLNRVGLEVVSLSGMDYHPLIKTATLSRNLDVNYLVAARKPL